MSDINVVQPAKRDFRLQGLPSSGCEKANDTDPKGIYQVFCVAYFA